MRRAVAASSLRAVAGQVGLTHRGLALFLEGSKPRPGTIRKLTTWYLDRPRDGEVIAPGDAEAILALLLTGVPAEMMDGTIRRVATAVRQSCDEGGVPPPSWIDAVLARRR